MVTKTLFFKNVALGASGSLQDGGAAPGTAQTTTGWTVAKTAAANFSLMIFNTTRAANTFSTTDPMATPSFSASSCWRTENQIDGTFDTTAWTFSVQFQSTVGTAQKGRPIVRVWRSSDPAGASPAATEITNAEQTGSIITLSAINTTVTSTITWTPATAFSLSNEYLFVQIEWDITTAGSSTTANILFEVGSGANIVTGNFIAVGDEWLQPLSNPVWTKNIPASNQPWFFTTDWKWVPPPVVTIPPISWLPEFPQPIKGWRRSLILKYGAFPSLTNPVPSFIYSWLAEPVRVKPDVPATRLWEYDTNWIAPSGVVITDLRNYWYQPFTDPVRLKPGLPAPEQQFFTIDYKWITPTTDLQNYWYGPLTDPVRLKVGQPTPEQVDFTIDYKWIAPPGDLHNFYWYRPLEDPVRYRPSPFPTAEQQYFTIDYKWLTPTRDLQNYWYRALDEPVRNRPPPIPTAEQLAFTIDYKWINPTTDLQNYWYRPLEEPVRLKPGLPAPEQHFFSIDYKWITPTTDLTNYWFDPLNEPVRYKIPFLAHWQQPFTTDANAPLFNPSWYDALSEPTRYRPSPFLPPHQQAFTTDPNAPLFYPSWYDALSEPVRLKPGLPTPEQLPFTIDFKWVAPPGDLGQYYWFRPLEEPVRYRQFPATYHQDFIMDAKWTFVSQIITDLRNFWYVPLNEPVRLKTGLPTPEQLSFATQWNWIDLQNYWYGPLTEPVRFKAFPAAEQQAFTIDFKWIAPPGDLAAFYWYRSLEEPIRYKTPLQAHLQQVLTRDFNAPLFYPSWYEALSEPTRYRPSPFQPSYQQSFATDTNAPLFYPSWYEALSEPVRFRAFPTPEQVFFTIDYKWIIPPASDLQSYWYAPLTEPVRLKPGLPTAEQAFFTIDWKWIAPIQVAVSYSLSASELFDKLAVRYTAADIVTGANVDVTEIGNKPSANVAISEIETGINR